MLDSINLIFLLWSTCYLAVCLPCFMLVTWLLVCPCFLLLTVLCFCACAHFVTNLMCLCLFIEMLVLLLNLMCLCLYLEVSMLLHNMMCMYVSWGAYIVDCCACMQFFLGDDDASTLIWSNIPACLLKLLWWLSFY